MTTHDHARVPISRKREGWKAFYNLNGGRVVGELWEPIRDPQNGRASGGSRKLREFNVKLGQDGRFAVDIGTGSGVKILFDHSRGGTP